MDAELTGIMSMSQINLVAVVGRSEAFGLQGKGVVVVHVSQVDQCETSHTAENALNEWVHLPWRSYDMILCSMRLSRSDQTLNSQQIPYLTPTGGSVTWAGAVVSLKTVDISRSNITWYWAKYQRRKSKTLFIVWTPGGHPMHYPCGRVMGQPLWVLLTKDTTRYRVDCITIAPHMLSNHGILGRVSDMTRKY